MKKYFPFAILLLLIYCAGCKKDAPASDSLQGTWELRQDIIGITGSSIYHKAGNDTIAKFTATNYEFSANGQVVKSGTYTVKRETANTLNRVGNRIIYNNQDNSPGIFFDIKNNQLSFIVDAYDGGGAIYGRVK